MTKSDFNRRLLTTFIDRVWNQRDIESAGEFVAPIYTVRHDPGDAWHMRDLNLSEFMQRVKTGSAPFPDQKFVLLDILASEDTVFVNWTWTGTHLADLGDFPPTGKLISMSGLTLYDIEANRLRGHWQVADRLGVYQQLMRNKQS